MSGADSTRGTRRILVVFRGGSSDSRVSGVLPALASESRAEIAGVFVEDCGLFQFAESPFAFELCRITTAPRRLEARTLERQLRVCATRARDGLRRIAERAGAPWSFRTHRGRLSTALAEMRDVDLLLISAPGPASRISDDVRAGVGPTRRRDIDTTRPIAVLVGRTDRGGRALDSAIELARDTGRDLVVLVPGAAHDARASVHGWSGAVGPRRVVIESVSSADTEDLAAAIRRVAPALVIVCADEAGLDESDVSRMQVEITCPLLIVR
jgi:hypothetical protein